LGLVSLATLSAYLSFFATASAEAPSVNPFDNTKWVSTVHDQGSTSTVVFGADGKWSEDWRSEHHVGIWWANKDVTVLVVKRDDGRRLRFHVRADHTLFREVGNIIYVQVALDAASAPTAGTTPATSQPQPLSSSTTLTEDQARAIVLIKGDNEEGTGFLVKTPDGPVVVTNIHVISNNPNVKITSNMGAPITILSYKGATDRDLAMIAIKDGDFKYLTLATDVSGTAQAGDPVVTPGNSEGGEVMLDTEGKVLGVGPDRIEFDNPVYHGNSGGPVIHLASGKVIGVVTQAVKVDVTNELDKASFGSPNSAIRHAIRYFGLRLDTVPKWEPYDWNRLQTETAFLDQFETRSRALDSYLNTPAPKEKKAKKNKPENINDDQDATLWEGDKQIVTANNNFYDQASGADTSQQMDATRALYGEIRDIAGTDMDAIQNPNNFYSFDQQRAKDASAYRKALLTELDTIGNNVSRMGSLPRTNN
jgi:hypothetical protein